jgi:AAA+ ATPase superfamily predicted ATPase
MDFVNRSDELAALAERWDSGRAEYFVLYGRRRVGKSALLLHFGDGRRLLYFESTSGGRQDQLEDLSNELADLTGRELHATQALTSWRAAFAAFSELAEAGPIMIVLDEFQFIARQEPEIGSLINRFVSQHADNSGLLFCIAGSDVSFFEKEVMGYGAATYGRRTGSLRLHPFAWDEIGPFVENWSAEDHIRAWAVFGGIPYYLNEIDASAGLTDAVLRVALYPDGLLRDEPPFLLSQETRIRDIASYMSSLRAIASGVTRLNEIAQRIGKTKSEAARPFLETLEEMYLVERRYPVTMSGSKNVRYAIKDPFLRFWFRFVAPAESRLQTRAQAERHLDERVVPELDKFVSEDAFERVCQAWTFSHVPDAISVGRWWGSIRQREEGQQRSRDFEADVAAIDDAGQVIALGSCKWADASTESHEHPTVELAKLETIRKHLHVPSAALYLFDRVGFSARLRELAAERDDVNLVLVGDMLR